MHAKSRTDHRGGPRFGGKAGSPRRHNPGNRYRGAQVHREPGRETLLPGIRGLPRVIHGIPSKKVVLKEGDIVSVDVGAFVDGFHGDCAATFPCGKVSEEALRLIQVTQQSFWEGVKHARAGQRVSDISHAVQQYVERHGYSVVRDFVGHGVGTKLHEAPEVPNFGPAGHGPRLQPGMTIAVEPMVCQGGWQVRVLEDKWTTVTADGSLAAHYENTILITEGDPEILTAPGELDA